MFAWRMNGLGNRFLILDATDSPKGAMLNHAQVLALVDPVRQGNFDQLMLLTQSGDADCHMKIWNLDGSEVGACGNATRCIGWKLAKERAKSEILIRTEADLLKVRPGRAPNMAIVDMGAPKLDWRSIPLSEPMETIRMELQVGPIDAPVLWGPSAVNMGNPHCVFFVDDAEAASVAEVGSMIEYHPLFPERTNVGFVQVIDRSHIRLRVWERGVGETAACGTGACAAVVASVRRRYVDRVVSVAVNGGTLAIEWLADGPDSLGHVLMSGAVELEAETRVVL